MLSFLKHITAKVYKAKLTKYICVHKYIHLTHAQQFCRSAETFQTKSYTERGCPNNKLIKLKGSVQIKCSIMGGLL